VAQTTWHLYVLRTKDGHLYTGITTDVERRLAEHGGEERKDGQGDKKPRGAKALRGRGPLSLVYSASIGDKGLALRAEHHLKRLARAEKEDLLGSRPTPEDLLDRLLPAEVPQDEREPQESESSNS